VHKKRDREEGEAEEAEEESRNHHSVQKLSRLCCYEPSKSAKGGRSERQNKKN